VTRNLNYKRIRAHDGLASLPENSDIDPFSEANDILSEQSASEIQNFHNKNINGSSAILSRRIFLSSTGIAAALAAQLLLPKKEEQQTLSDTNVFGSTNLENLKGRIPFSSRREYGDLLLSNGMRVVLVHDRDVPRASVALSIRGAGQFSDPEDLPGLAHLMEHMVLSSRGKSYNPFREQDDLLVDFEEWLEDQEGASNAFTAPDMVCFHFTSPPEVLPEAVNHFSRLFRMESIEKVCQNNEGVLRREARRVDAELDFTTDESRKFYLLKSRANPEHPFARFGQGSIETLETTPQQEGIDVGNRLVQFFDEHYLPKNAVLVFVSPNNLRTLERFAAPFANMLSRRQSSSASTEERSLQETNPSEQEPLLYTTPFLPKPHEKLSQTILLRSRDDPFFNENVETLTLDWPLELNYNNQGTDALISAKLVGFVIAQIIARRGPGSLYSFLVIQDWAPPGLKGLPRITFPIDVSGFQIMRMEIGLTVDGFGFRSEVIAAVYKSINVVLRISQPGQPFLLSRELMIQYLTVATIHGYALAPRPPDAVELGVDAQIFGVGSSRGVGVAGVWPLAPARNDEKGIAELRRVVASTLVIMADPTKAMVTIAASAKAISKSDRGAVDQPVPRSLFSPLWKVESMTGAPYFEEERVSNAGLVDPLIWVTEQLEKEALGPPVLNPLIPTRLRPARPIVVRRASDGSSRFFYLESGKSDDSLRLSTTGWGVSGDATWREFMTRSPKQSVEDVYKRGSWEERALSTIVGEDWTLWQAVPSIETIEGLPLPIAPPEPTCRCSFVVQLLSRRPEKATSREAARAQLWLNSFDDSIRDLAELGAPAGLAYETSFNQYGLRICFRGISQSLPSYARRFCRRIVRHHVGLRDGSVDILPLTLELSITQTSRARFPSATRQGQIVGALKRSTPVDVAAEGAAFLNSVSGGMSLAQGDLLPKEAVKLLTELQTIFQNAQTARPRKSTGPPPPPAPSLSKILYRPLWKPRSSSSCYLPGVPLISDACGRVAR